MYTHHADIVKNRFYITFKGKMELEEIKAACASIIREARRLKPGFGTITDIGETVTISEEARQVMQESMKTLKELGMGHVVRIVGGGSIVVSNQWQRTSRATGYVAEEANTLAEAEAILDKAGQG